MFVTIDFELGPLVAKFSRAQHVTGPEVVLACPAEQYTHVAVVTSVTFTHQADIVKQNGIVPVVGVDGWSRIINENQQFDGMDFEQDNESCTCRIYRKDRNHPICVTEWMDECRREPFKTREGREITGPWQSHPKRMLRHKAMIQCARLAFGFAGIYDKDEAERIVENTAYTAERQPERDITPVNDETMQEINTLLIALDKTWDDDLLPLCSQIFRRDIRASSELTQAEAVKALGFLKQKATEQKVAA